MFSRQWILAVTLAMTVTTRINAADEPSTTASTVRSIAVDVNNVQGPLDTSFKECIGAGRANEGLRADWQDQLREVERDCGFKYIRMHGLLTDDMGVYQEDKQGHPSYNWQYIDQLYDFLLSLHMKPFVELSFMPNGLATSNKTKFWWNANVTPPKSYVQWGDLISHLVNHFQERYGHDEVASWYFEVWNEPDSHNFWAGSMEDYFHLYDAAARAVKSVSPDYRVGGPASARSPWDAAFINFCFTNHTPLDFISTHSYAVRSGRADDAGVRGVVMDPATNSIIERMAKERKMIDQSPMPGLPLHFTEWSSSYTPTDFIHDSYMEAAFILSKIKGSYHSVNSMSYWVFTDIFEERGPRMTPFHGGFGLINYQDLKKPAFYAYKFLNELGPFELADADPASWVCKDKDNSIQALFWDHTLFVPPKGMNDEQFYNREFPAKDIGHTMLSLTNLPAGSYSLEIYHIGYRANDVFTGYLDLGSPSQLTPTQVNILREASTGDPESVETIHVETGKPFVREFPMRQNDVYFVKLLPLTAG
jgi:xylan 1,4-beta-xylosidase